MILSTAHNKRVSGYATTWLRPNPHFARTSDTRKTLSDILLGGYYKDRGRLSNE